MDDLHLPPSITTGDVSVPHHEAGGPPPPPPGVGRPPSSAGEPALKTFGDTGEPHNTGIEGLAKHHPTAVKDRSDEAIVDKVIESAARILGGFFMMTVSAAFLTPAAVISTIISLPTLVARLAINKGNVAESLKDTLKITGSIVAVQASFVVVGAGLFGEGILPHMAKDISTKINAVVDEKFLPFIKSGADAMSKGIGDKSKANAAADEATKTSEDVGDEGF
jgi:hypothetical protein